MDRPNPFVAHTKNFIDKVNAHARQELKFFEGLGGKRIVVVDMEGSCWEGILTGYSFMYVEIDRDGGKMKIVHDNIRKIIVPGGDHAVEQE